MLERSKAWTGTSWSVLLTFCHFIPYNSVLIFMVHLRYTHSPSVHACMSLCVVVGHGCVYRRQRTIPGVFLCSSQPYCLIQNLSLKLELASVTTWLTIKLQRSAWFWSCPPEYWGLSSFPASYLGTMDFQSRSCACMTWTSPIESSPVLLTILIVTHSSNATIHFLNLCYLALNITSD